MKYRTLGQTGYKVSEVGFGSWAIGGDWGDVSESNAIEALNTAIDNGVNFLDTADVYGDGRSEKIIAQVLQNRSEDIIVATKAGRRLNPHVADGYTIDNIEKFVDRSLQNLRMDSLDLLQLHCPPTEVYYKPELFAGLDELKKKGKIQHYGVSVEKVEEALKAIEYPGVETVQIIFNIFRQRPKELFFQQAKKKNIGVIVRVPLASGLLTGKYDKNATFAKTDHRNYNRKGEAFDVGETFAGVDFKQGITAVEELKAIKPKDMSMVELAIRWILDHPEISVVIPGAKNSQQALGNTSVSEMRNLSKKETSQVNSVYDQHVKPSVHHRW